LHDESTAAVDLSGKIRRTKAEGGREGERGRGCTWMG
jgi:hypothetical protein